MKFIETNYFLSQLDTLALKFPKIRFDYEEFKQWFDPTFSISLWSGYYKERIKNSSIPIGKRGGFRIIVKVCDDKVIPLTIYSKNMKENISFDEIKIALKSVINELENL